MSSSDIRADKLQAAWEVTNKYLATFGDTLSPESKAGVVEFSEYLMKELAAAAPARPSSEFPSYDGHHEYGW